MPSCSHFFGPCTCTVTVGHYVGHDGVDHYSPSRFVRGFSPRPLLIVGGDWKRIWPVFGTANQLLAALTLVTATAWLIAEKRRYLFTVLPAAFMVITTIASLWQL